MKSLKRLTSLLICFAMLFGCVLVHADEATEAEAVVYGVEENALITALGIAEYTEADLSAPITRGEFYMLLCKANAYPETVTGETLFSDLAVGADYETWTKTLYKVGVITTTRDGKVNVGDNITGMEAISLVMRTLGYGPRADALGGYPTGYLAVANQADVSDGIEEIASAELTKGMAVELIYNALHADMMVQSIGTGESEYKVSKDTNLLSTAFGIEKIEGVVDVDISRVMGVNDVNPFHIEVDGFTMESRAIANPYDYLGYHVEAYYTNKRLDEPKVIYMEKTDLNEEYVIDLDDIDKVTSTDVRAYSEDKEKYVNYDLEKGVAVIVNGVATKQAFSKDIYEGYYGELKLLDNTGDGNADIVFANIYENIIVGHYDAKAKTIYDKYDNTRKLVFDNTTNDPYVIIYDASGEEVAPSALAKDSVVSVYHSPEDAYQKYVRAYVSTAVAQGEIEEIEDEKYVIINGLSYEISDIAKERVENILKVGTPVLFRLDVNGEIADGMVDNGGESRYGYIVSAGTEGGLDSRLGFKFYDSNNTFVDAYAAKKISVDGIKYNNTDLELFETIYAAAQKMTPGVSMPQSDLTGDALYAFYLEEHAPIGSIVKYTLNSNGEVSAIDTIMYDSETVADRNSNHGNNNSFYAVEQTNIYYRQYANHRTFGPKVAVNAETIMFYYPAVTNAEERNLAFDDGEYIVGKVPSVVSHNKHFNSAPVYGFYESTNQIVSKLVASPRGEGAGGSIVDTTKLAVVQGLCKMLDPENGEIEVTGVTIMSDAGTTKIPVKDDFTFATQKAPTELKNELGEVINPPIEGYHYYVDNSGEQRMGRLRAQDLEIGDVIRYSVDNKGYMNSLTFYYRPSIEGLYAYFIDAEGNVKAELMYDGIVAANLGEYSNTTAIRRGYVYQSFKEGCYVYFSNDFNGNRAHDLAILSTKTINDCEFVYYTASSLTGYRYEKSEIDSLKVSGISGSDLKSYLDTGDDCSYIILHTYNGQPYALVDFAD